MNQPVSKAFPHIQEYDTKHPEHLNRQLVHLEDNVDRAIDRLRDTAEPKPSAMSNKATAKNSIFSLGPGQMLTVDTSSASGAAVLPALTPSNFGHVFRLVKPVGANTIAVSCQDAAVKHNGGAFPTITAVGMTTFYCDKYGYYS